MFYHVIESTDGKKKKKKKKLAFKVCIVFLVDAMQQRAHSSKRE